MMDMRQQPFAFKVTRIPFKVLCGVVLCHIALGCTSKNDNVLKVLSFRDRQSAALREALPHFEAEHGVKVQFDDIPAATVATKMMTDLAAGGTYDVYAIDEPFIPQFQESLLPVTEWPHPLSEAELLSFEPKALEAASVGKRQIGLPVNGNVYQYIYRKDLFESEIENNNFLSRFGRPLLPPRNFNELVQIAEFFHRPPKLYGFAPFTKMSEGTTVEFLWLLAAHGFSPERRTQPVDPKDIQLVLRNYTALLKTAPKAARAWHHTERMSAYAKGKIAQMMTWNSFFFDLEDDNKSLVAGRTGYARSPGDASTSLAGTWIAGIRRDSKNAAKASAFVRWWTSRDINEKLVHKGLSSARMDVLTSTHLGEKFPWLGTTHINFQNSFLRPRHKQYRSASDELSKAFTHWIAEQSNEVDAAQALLNALSQMDQLALGQTAQKEAR